MRIDMVNENQVVIDDRITVDRISTRYTFTDNNAKGTVQLNIDPHYYANGVNWLSVERSVERAFDRVQDIAHRYNYYDVGRDEVLLLSIRKMIEDNRGRDEVYKLAGQIGVGRTLYGLYEGVPFAVVFAAAVAGDVVV